MVGSVVGPRREDRTSRLRLATEALGERNGSPRARGALVLPRCLARLWTLIGLTFLAEVFFNFQRASSSGWRTSSQSADRPP